MKSLKNIFRFIALGSLLLALTSCASSLSEKVSIESFENLEIMGFAGVKADIGFRNESGYKIKVQSVGVTLKEGGSQLVTLNLKDELEIPRRTELVVEPTLWSINDLNMLAALAAAKKITSGQTDSYKVDIVASAKAGIFKREVELKGLSLTELMKDVDLSTIK